MSADSLPAKRRHIRFPADEGDLAWIDYGTFDAPFAPVHPALIVEEAPMSGCGLLLLNPERCPVGTRFRVQVGRMAPLQAQVQWLREIENGIARVGVQFLE
jgi:hypothetical protein